MCAAYACTQGQGGCVQAAWLTPAQGQHVHVPCHAQCPASAAASNHKGKLQLKRRAVDMRLWRLPHCPFPAMAVPAPPGSQNITASDSQPNPTMFSRRDQSTLAAIAGECLAARSTSASEPREQNSVMTQGGTYRGRVQAVGCQRGRVAAGMPAAAPLAGLACHRPPTVQTPRKLTMQGWRKLAMRAASCGRQTRWG